MELSVKTDELKVKLNELQGIRENLWRKKIRNRSDTKGIMSMERCKYNRSIGTDSFGVAYIM